MSKGLGYLSEDQLEQIKCVLAQERRLTPSEHRLRVLGIVGDGEKDQYYRAQRWGLFDGYNSRFRPSTLSGLVCEKTPRKWSGLIEDGYTDAYELGRVLRRESDACFEREDSCDRDDGGGQDKGVS